MKTRVLLTLLAAAAVGGCATTTPTLTPTLHYYSPIRHGSADIHWSTEWLMDIAEMTLEYQQEISAWAYCDIDSGDLVSIGTLEFGTYDAVLPRVPEPDIGEFPCAEIHTHPWDDDTAPGPSSSDLRGSAELPGVPHLVVDRFGVWGYIDGRTEVLCAWASDYSTLLPCTAI